MVLILVTGLNRAEDTFSRWLPLPLSEWCNHTTISHREKGRSYMNNRPLRDKAQRIIGYIETKPDGSQTGRDTAQRIKGYYYAKGNAHETLASGSLATATNFPR
jgi:hypothetical protein